MNTKTAFLPTPNGRISKWLDDIFGIKTISDFNMADLIVFPGGLDVDPNLYNEPVGQRTSFSSKVDNDWAAHYKSAIENKKKFLGICKGSQFLTAMSGASLYQHVSNHALIDTHSINIKGELFEVTSTHHQMMNPFILEEDNYDILAFSEERRSSIYLNGYDDEMEPPKKEPEAVFYKGNGALSIQFHPEFMDNSDPVQDVIKEWMKMMFDYTPEKIFDKYHSKSRGTSGNLSSSDIDLGSIPEHVFDEFVEKYLTQ